jgi:competence protein ComEA
MRLVLAGLGLVIMIVGGVVAVRQGQDSERVEIITEGTEKTEGTEIIVDVGGAVESPGVYQLAAGSRVNDALTAAGGLSQDADRGWVARYLNLAQVVIDGAKIYIPEIGSTGSISSTSSTGTISINTATASELDSLWGVGEKRAADIISNRPYSSIDELITKAGIPENVLKKIRTSLAL